MAARAKLPSQEQLSIRFLKALLLPGMLLLILAASPKQGACRGDDRGSDDVVVIVPDACDCIATS